MKAKTIAVFQASVPSFGQACLPAGRATPWFSIAFAVLAGLVFIMNSGITPKTVQVADMPTVATQSTRSFNEAGVGAGAGDAGISNKTMMAPEYYPRPMPPQDVPITDTREFLKTDYNATIRTRDVSTITRRVETTVRGFGGRIDSSNNSPKWGFVSFVVPASKFDSFRNEIESLTDARFITTEIRNENLLPQKQSIEEQRKQIDKELTELRASRQSLIANHIRVLASLQSQLDQAPSEQKYLFQIQINNENASYAKQLNSFDARIKDTQTNSEWVSKQDQSLIDNVATVRGTISINWISIWDVIQLYVSTSWIIVILLSVAFVSYLFERHRRFC